MSHLWLYLPLLVLIALEGDVVIILGAGAAAAGVLDPVAVFCIAILGNLISDVLWYVLGYYGRVDLLLHRVKWVRWAGVTSERLDVFKRLVNHHVIRLLIFAKLTNWMMIPVLIAIGMARVSWKRWFWLILVSDVLIAVVYVSLGYFMTSSYLQIQKGMGYIAVGFTLLFILVVILYGRHLLKHKDLIATFGQQDLP